MGSGRIQFECLKYQPSLHRIGNFWLSGTTIQIADWCRDWVKPLLQTSIEPFPRLFAQISDEIGSNHGLDIRRKPTASRIEIKALVGEVNFNPDIHEVAEVCPVLQIARASINLVDDYTVRLTAPEKSKHIQKDRPASLRRGLPFLEGPRDLNTVFLRVSGDCILLLLE
jgi:hypothetical protein